VLLDGQRSVGSALSGAVDINTFPQQLIRRVEMVTGGASAVYGSDAVSGVVNFILDKTYTGVKGELSGGVTSYGDDRSYKANLASGFGFNQGRGHVLLSGEATGSDAVPVGSREWENSGYAQMNNPNYTPTNGQPQRLALTQVGFANAAPGGIIVSGPLKGTAFGAGGMPFQLNYGDLYTSQNIHGATGERLPMYCTTAIRSLPKRRDKTLSCGSPTT